MGDVEELALDPAINALVVNITTAAIMCLDADEENTARFAAFERGIVGDIAKFRADALTSLQARLAAVEAERDAARGKALEEAAKVAEQQAAGCMEWDDAVGVCNHVAASIRSLKGTDHGS